MSGLLSFPFVPLADCLRSLSLSGTIGNLVAILIYVVVSLIPAGVWILLKRNKQVVRADIMLPVMSGYIFYMLYQMINPFSVISELESVWKICLNVTFYSILIFYCVLRVVAYCKDGKLKQLYQVLHILLIMAMVAFVLQGVIVLISIPGMLDQIRSVNTALGDSELLITFGMIIIRSLVTIVSLVFNVGICYMGRALLLQIREDLYSDESILLSEKLGLWCRNALLVTAGLPLFVNLLQLILHRSLQQLDTNTILPIDSMLLALITLLLTKYLTLNQKLKQENDAFI